MKKYFIFAFILGIFMSVGFYFFNEKKSSIQTTFIKKNTNDFSLISPPSESRVGIVSDINGEIFWQSRVADVPSKVTSLDQVQQAELVATGKDSLMSIEFDEIVAINLFADSELEFLQTMSTNFVLRQNKGKITYKKIGDTPLSIRAMHLLTNVVDGEIVITIDSENHLIDLEVVSGAIKIAYNDADYNTQYREFVAGTKFSFNDDDRELTVAD